MAVGCESLTRFGNYANKAFTRTGDDFCGSCGKTAYDETLIGHRIKMESFATVTEASKLFASLPEVVQAYISQRGGAHEIPPYDVLRKIPETLHDNPNDFVVVVTG